VARFGIRADGGSDGAAEGAPEDRALAATDFIAYGCAGGSAESSAYCCIHSGIPGVRGSAEQRG
jgi:hypothetical protein